MSNTAEQRAHLLKYMELGLRPIPLRGKVANYHWKSFVLTQSNMESYITPGTNWGIRTGQIPIGTYFYAVDIDDKLLLSRFMELNPLPEKAPIVSTGRGFHIYLSWGMPAETRHSPGLDIIANGYVVVPPSVHPSGKIYRFIVPLGSHIPMLNPRSIYWPLPTLPFRPNPIAGNARNSAGHLGGDSFDWDNIFNGVSEGQRHNTLVRYLGILHSRWDTEDEALAKVSEWNKLNNPPIPEHELVTTVRYCYREWGRRKVGNGNR